MSSPAGFQHAARYGAPAVEGPEPVRVWLLGGFQVSVGSRIIEESQWRLRKAASLIKLLALAHGHRLHREQAMDVLWPELGMKAASNNLRQTLHVARRTLEHELSITSSSGYLELRDEQLVLCPGERLWVDVEALVSRHSNRTCRGSEMVRCKGCNELPGI